MEEGGTERTAGRIIRKLTWQYFSVVVFSNRLSAHSKGLAKTRCYRRVHTRLVLIFPSQRQERVRKALPRKKAKDGERTAGRIFRQFDGEISHLQVSPFMGNSISERHYNARSRRAFRNVYRLPFPGVIHFLQVYYYRHNPYLWLTGLTRLITTARIFFLKVRQSGGVPWNSKPGSTSRNCGPSANYWMFPTSVWNLFARAKALRIRTPISSLYIT